MTKTPDSQIQRKLDLYEIESTKFVANFIDRMATAFMIAGIVVPLTTARCIDLIPSADRSILGHGGLFILLAIVLHLVGHCALRRLA